MRYSSLELTISLAKGLFMCSEISENRVRLQRFEIFSLFGEFDYCIPLRIEEHVTAVIAPNGTGKTLCLRLIAALFSRKWSVFADIQFDKIRYTFTDSSVLTISKSKKKESTDGISAESSNLEIRLKLKSGQNIEWKPRTQIEKRTPSIDRFLPFLTRVSPTRWQHDHTGQILSVEEVVEAYADQLPESVRLGLFGKVPPEIATLTDSIDCRLIETQRLLIIRDDFSGRYYSPEREARSTLAITEKAKSLKDFISKELNAYATLSQSLDRSFPRRVILRSEDKDSTGLATRLASLDDKRKELMKAGILDTESDEAVQLPAGPLEPAIARVLQVYAEDTEKKLSSLSPLLAKITLFKKLIDQRFSTKDVQISKRSGIEVVAQNGRITLDKLSSGEQHQLVLFFELLFEIKDNSLILIDEPELSLHVAWQKKFIGDMISIITLNKFDVVLATHSPQLISRWEDLVVELGDVYEGEKEPDEELRAGA